LASENERLTVFVCYHRAVQYLLDYTRCIEKSRFGAVTFDKRVVCPFMFRNLSELKSGKECDGLHSLSGADFRRDDRCFYWLLTLKHFVFSSL
jgi:hypothetical protein